MDIQALVDSMSECSRRDRSQYHLTLGGLIKKLEAADPDLFVKCSDGQIPGELSSYRGYYSDLAFEPTDEATTVGVLLSGCKKALDATFGGYKGGDFVMGADTPLWISPYGLCHELAVMDMVEIEGQAILVVKHLTDEP